MGPALLEVGGGGVLQNTFSFPCLSYNFSFPKLSLKGGGGQGWQLVSPSPKSATGLKLFIFILYFLFL